MTSKNWIELDRSKKMQKVTTRNFCFAGKNDSQSCRKQTRALYRSLSGKASWNFAMSLATAGVDKITELCANYDNIIIYKYICILYICHF